MRSEAANLNPIMYLILFLLERGGLTSGANSELTLGQPLALAGFAGRETYFAGADVNMSSVGVDIKYLFKPYNCEPKAH